MKTIQIFLLVLVSLQLNAQNDNTQIISKNYLSLELDPAPFLLGGYSFSLKYSPKNANHFSFMGSVYSSEFPDKMMGKSNYEKGFRDLKIETSFAFFADYFLKNDRTGFHFGPSVFLYSKSVGLENTVERTSFNSIYPNIRIGYVYKPFMKSGFYINPWFNLGKEYVLDDKNYIEGLEYSTENISYVLAIHLGYRIIF